MKLKQMKNGLKKDGNLIKTLKHPVHLNWKILHLNLGNFLDSNLINLRMTLIVLKKTKAFKNDWEKSNGIYKLLVSEKSIHRC